MLAVVVIFCLLYFCNVQGNGQVPEEDSYILNFDSPIYVCPDEESQKFIDTSQIAIGRHNETCSYMTGAISFLKGMQSTTMVEIIIEKEISGSFEMFASHEICNLCKELGDPESTYKDYLQHFGFPEVCPFEPNTFAVNDLVAHSKDLPINSVTVGRYQVTMNFIENPSSDCLDEKSFLACLKLDFIIEPM
ncbi:unnamed protein product, partial [Brenthis ino]